MSGGCGVEASRVARPIPSSDLPNKSKRRSSADRSRHASCCWNVGARFAALDEGPSEGEQHRCAFSSCCYRSSSEGVTPFVAPDPDAAPRPPGRRLYRHPVLSRRLIPDRPGRQRSHCNFVVDDPMVVPPGLVPGTRVTVRHEPLEGGGRRVMRVGIASHPWEVGSTTEAPSDTSPSPRAARTGQEVPPAPAPQSSPASRDEEPPPPSGSPPWLPRGGGRRYFPVATPVIRPGHSTSQRIDAELPPRTRTARAGSPARLRRAHPDGRGPTRVLGPNLSPRPAAAAAVRDRAAAAPTGHVPPE